MQYELAPMEGVTTWVYRMAYHRHFTPADRYFTPFIAPNMNQGLNTRERSEVLPEHNVGMHLIPQLLTNRADYFLSACQELEQLGYREVNLNLGCPSGTVTAKGKGAGFLGRPEELERFLDEIFAECSLRISIKTRIGLTDESEWPQLLTLFRRYPCTELIVHPRIRSDFYKGSPRMSAFDQALEQPSVWPVVYNGNLFTSADLSAFHAQYPTVDTVMLGRGVICNPWLMGGTPNKAVLEQFHEDLFEQYRCVLFGDGPVLCKLKGVWTYLIQLFTNPERYWKTIRKTRHLSEYRTTVNALFHNEDLLPNAGYRPET